MTLLVLLPNGVKFPLTRYEDICGLSFFIGGDTLVEGVGILVVGLFGTVGVVVGNGEGFEGFEGFVEVFVVGLLGLFCCCCSCCRHFALLFLNHTCNKNSN